MLLIVSFVFCLFCAVGSNVVPEAKCQLEDSKCMVPAFQQAVVEFVTGIPDFDVEVLDVMAMNDVKFNLAGLDFSLSEGRLKGLKNSVVDSVKWSQKKKRFEVEFHVNCSIRGHYTAGGVILILPITGDGQITLKMKNVVVKLYVDYDVEKDANNKEIIVPKKFNFDFEVKDGAHFNLTDLFNGDKELSDTMHTFLNENWRQISVEFGRPIMAAAADKIFESVKNFFRHNPIEDITA